MGLCLHTYIHGKSGNHSSSAKSIYFTLVPLLLTANTNDEEDRGTKNTTILSTQPPQFSFSWAGIQLETLFWKLLSLTPNSAFLYAIVGSW